jgi:hypothetical protein
MGDITEMLEAIKVETASGRIKQWHGLGCQEYGDAFIW